MSMTPCAGLLLDILLLIASRFERDDAAVALTVVGQVVPAGDVHDGTPILSSTVVERGSTQREPSNED